MSTILRTLRNLRRVGIRDAAHQLQYQGDTKAGTLIGIDRYGNKYFENLEEELPRILSLRTRWVDFKEKELDASHIEPGWHAWISYMVDKPPTQDPILQTNVRAWEIPEHRPNFTATRGAFKTYSTVKPKISAWDPKPQPRA